MLQLLRTFLRIDLYLGVCYTPSEDRLSVLEIWPPAPGESRTKRGALVAYVREPVSSERDESKEDAAVGSGTLSPAGGGGE